MRGRRCCARVALRHWLHGFAPSCRRTCSKASLRRHNLLCCTAGPLLPAASSVPESLADLQRAWRRCCTEAHHERVLLLCACGAARVAAWLRSELPLDLLSGILCALASGFAQQKATAVNTQGSKTSQADPAGAADHSTFAALPDSSACQQEPPAEKGLSLCQADAASAADATTNSTLAGSSSLPGGRGRGEGINEIPGRRSLCG